MPTQALRLISAQFISQICDRLMLVAMIWVMASLYDPKFVPWFVGVGALPHLLLAAKSPKLIGRFGALRTVIAADWARGLLLLATLPLISSQGSGTLLVLFSLQLLVNIFGAFFNPAILILPTRVVAGERAQQKVTAGVESCFSLSSVVAPMLSVACYAVAGLRGVVAINALSYLIAATIEHGIREVGAVSGDGAGAGSVEREAAVASSKGMVRLAVIWGRDALVPYLLGGFLLLNLLLGPLLIFIPLYVRHVFSAGFTAVGALETALGMGTALGSLLSALLPFQARPLRWIVVALGIDCVAYVAFTVSPNIAVAIGCLFVLGLALAVANVLILGVFQRRALQSELATVMSWVNLISVATLPVSMAMVGVLIGHFEAGAIRTIAVCCSSAGLALLAMLVVLPLVWSGGDGSLARAVRSGGAALS